MHQLSWEQKLSPAMYALSQLFLFMCSMMISCMVAMHHQEERLEHSSSTIRCIERERQALLHFKQGLSDPCGILTSWGSVHDEDQHLHHDCCQWRGVGCSNVTDHVISLNLRAPTCDDSFCCNGLRGNISSSLLALEHLNYLDLSRIDFLNYSIPKFISSLVRLTYLNLSDSNISGEIPSQFKNLSNLQILDLGGFNSLYAKSLAWASSLSSLKTLDLSRVKLTDATDWVHVINSLPSLTYLSLDDCRLPNLYSLSRVNYSKSLSYIYLAGNFLSTASIYPWLFNISSNLVALKLLGNQLNGLILEAVVNLNSLSYLDLSYNQLQGPIPEAIVNLSSLSYLALCGNQLQGPILEGFGNMKSLSHLDLSFNQFTGRIPKSFKHLSSLHKLDLSRNNLTGDLFTGSLPDFSRFPSLVELDLSYNQLNGSFPSLANNYSSLRNLYLSNNQISGSFPEDLGQLSQLEVLDLSSNFFNGTVTEAHLSNLPLVIMMDLSFNKLLAFNISPIWTPSFQLRFIWLDSCRLGPHFPNWLQTQHILGTLSLFDAGISDTLPGWFFEIFDRIQAPYVNLAHNGIHGALPDSGFQNFTIQWLDLSYNFLEGSIPSFLTQLEYLDLSNNKLSGSIFSGFIATNATLQFLDLTNNNLSGELPDCWMYLNLIQVLNLGNNSFSGNIPNSFGNLTSLVVLDLSSNNLSGKVPLSMKYCTSLQVLDLSENFISGQVPDWFGNNLVMLNVLILRQNKFFGSLPWEICHLHYIQVLDLSVNNIIGTIPNCLYNSTFWSEEVNSSKMDLDQAIFQWTYIKGLGFSLFPWIRTMFMVDIHANLVWKGSRREYWKNLALVKSIDLSSNQLSGEIPVEISSLVELQSLNLSRNYLTGPITWKLGQLKQLESLDLSRNRLFGEIPTSLATLNFLSTLDLSYNNLSGVIPSGIQLEGFNESTYMGNPELCGPPLQKMCEEDATQSDHHNGEEAKDQDEESLSLGLYISIGLGFISGFWGACGILVFKRSWRYTYFSFCNQLYDKIFVAVVVYIVRPIARFRA